jgi:hypothetical protein
MKKTSLWTGPARQGSRCRVFQKENKGCNSHGPERLVAQQTALNKRKKNISTINHLLNFPLFLCSGIFSYIS